MVMKAGAEQGRDDEGASVDARPAPRDGSSSSSASTSRARGSRKTSGPGLLPSAVVADVGAFLFGYHTAVCNAPLSAIASELGFADDDGVKGVVVSALVLGGAVGGLTVGALSDKWKEGDAGVGERASGRRDVGERCGDERGEMIVGRFIAGVGVGASSQIVPLYLSEIAPPARAGR